MTPTQEIYTVRKNGIVAGYTRRAAEAIVAEAASQGYTFTRRQTVNGYAVADMDD